MLYFFSRAAKAISIFPCPPKLDAVQHNVQSCSQTAAHAGSTARASLPLCSLVLSFPKPVLLSYSQLDATFKKLCIGISQCFLTGVCSSSVTFSRDASSLHRSSQEPGSSPQDVGIVPLEATPQCMTLLHWAYSARWPNAVLS